jgi:hypothetical protein
LLTIAHGARPAGAEEGWHFKVTPYLWFPSLGSTVRYAIPASSATGTFDVQVGADDYLDNLVLGALLAGEVRRGRAVAAMDLFYTDFSSDQSMVRSVDFGTGPVAVNASLDAGTRSSLQTLVWTLLAGYALVSDSTGTLDLVGGVRYAGVEESTDWTLTTTITGPGGTETFPMTGSVGTSQDLWDAVVGVHGSLALGRDGFFVPYYFDIGTGSSDVTWQALLGFAYAFQPVDAVLVYRHLEYQGGDSDALQEMSFSGAAVGAVFHF